MIKRAPVKLKCVPMLSSRPGEAVKLTQTEVKVAAG